MSSYILVKSGGQLKGHHLQPHILYLVYILPGKFKLSNAHEKYGKKDDV